MYIADLEWYYQTWNLKLNIIEKEKQINIKGLKLI